MSVGANFDILHKRGNSFALPLEDTAADTPAWTSGTISGSIRKNTGSAEVVAFTGVITDGPNKKGTLSLTQTQIDAITSDDAGDCLFKETCYIYDMKITYADLTTQPLLEGLFTIVSAADLS